MLLSNSKRLIQLFICFVVFFSFSVGVNAKKDYVTQDTTNLYYSCNQSNNCVPLCIYSCQNDLSICSTANIEGSGGDIGYVGKYYTQDGNYTQDSDGRDIKWEFGMLPKKLILWRANYIISSKNVMYAKNSLDKENNSEVRDNLKNSFICPQYAIVGKDKFTLITSPDDTYYAEALSYSFIDELDTVIKNASSFSNSQQGTTPLQEMHEAYAFMSKAAGYDSYDSSLSEEQNNTKICAFLKEKVGENGSIEQFVKDFSNDENLAKEIINEKLSDSAVNHADSRYRYIYTYENLQSLLEEDKVVDSNNVSYLKRINDIYSLSERNAISYFNNKCDLGLSLDDMQELQDQTSNTVMEKLKSVTHELADIDLDENFDCDTLLGGDVAKLISGAYFIIEIGAIAIFIVFTVLDYAKAILSGEADEIKKCNQKLVKRLIIVAVIFLLPALVNTVLRLFHIEGFNSDHPLCIDISNK